MRKRPKSGTRQYRRGRFAILTLRVCLYGCVGPAATLPGAQQAELFSFERYEVVTGAAERQTILTGFLVGGVADLATAVGGGPRDGYRYRPWDEGGRIHEMDYDLDGRSDLVFWNDDRFVVHLQDERGLFAAKASTTFTTEVAFDSDQIASLAVAQEVRRRRIDDSLTGSPTGRVLRSLTDLTGDGVADLVVFSLEIRSMWSVHSTYEVHPGAPTPDGGTVFAPDVGARDSVGRPPVRDRAVRLRPRRSG